tara:strand:- start:15987 stop:16097 length:111 start_codon:yes stop_codon:yes gene_type:complete
VAQIRRVEREREREAGERRRMGKVVEEEGVLVLVGG